MKLINCLDIEQNRYQIFENGSIYDLKNKRYVEQNIDKDCYAILNLNTSSGRKKFRVHRLVAIMYIPTTDLSLEINHKDGNKLNNHINNLEWVTSQENIKHAVENNLRGNKNIYSEELVENICKLIEDGFPPLVIIHKLNLDDNDSTRNLVYGIKGKHIWNNISCNYNFSDEKCGVFVTKKYSYDIICNICELILKNKRVTEIALDIFGSKEKRYLDLISAIKNNKKYKEISKMYW